MLARIETASGASRGRHVDKSDAREPERIAMASPKSRKRAGMNDVAIRLACIEAAAQHVPFRPEYVVTLANDYYRFVSGKTDGDISACVAAFVSRERASQN